MAERDTPEPAQPEQAAPDQESRSNFQRLINQRREFASTLPTQNRTPEQKDELERLDLQIDQAMERARQFGRIAGVQTLVDGQVRGVLNTDDPFDRLLKLDELLEKYQTRGDEGAYYTERALLRLRDTLFPTHERILNEEPARNWEWTKEGYRERLIEAKKQAIGNAEQREEEEKELPRAATLRIFTDIYDIVRDPNEIVLYAQALQIVANPDSIDPAQREDVVRDAQALIDRTPQGQKVLYEQALKTTQDENGDLRRNIDILTRQQSRRLLRFALQVIEQEESFPVDKQNREVLDRAIAHAERFLPEALHQGMLKGLPERIGNLHRDEYRDKIKAGSLNLRHELDFIDLQKRVEELANEDEFWAEIKATSETIEQWTGIRKFYIKRALAAIRKEFSQGRANWDERFAREREIQEQLNSGQINDPGEIARLQSELGDLVRDESTTLGEWTIREGELFARRRDEIEARKHREETPLVDRRMGYIELHPFNPQQLRDAVEFVLTQIESETSQFDANSIIQDSTRLGDEISLRGEQVKMPVEERKRLRNEAEGRLLVYVADWFVSKGLVEPWGQIMDLFSKHGMERLSAVSRAGNGEVMHAVYLYEHNSQFRKYFRPQVDDILLGDWVRQGEEREKIKRRLVYVIMHSQLKGHGELGLASQDKVLERIGKDQSDAEFLNLFSLGGLDVQQNRIVDAGGNEVTDNYIEQLLKRDLAPIREKEARIKKAQQEGQDPGEQLTDEERLLLRKDGAEKVVNIAIKTLTVFSFSSEHGAPSLRTRVNEVERKGELVSMEDAIRALRYVRDAMERAVFATNGQYQKIDYNVRTGETDAQRYARVEKERNRRRGNPYDPERPEERDQSGMWVNQAMRNTLVSIVAQGYDAELRDANNNPIQAADGQVMKLRDILSKDWLDPQYNYYVAFDHKLRTAFFGYADGQLKHIKDVLGRRGTILRNPNNQTEEQMGILHAMEALRRDYFEDEEFIYTEFLKIPDFWVHGLTNLPFGLKRLAYGPSAIRYDQDNLVIRGKDLLPYLSYQHRNIGREFGVDFRGLVALFERRSKDEEDKQGGIGDNYEIERWINRTVAAERMRKYTIGGVIDKQVVRGILQSPVKDVRTVAGFRAETAQTHRKHGSLEQWSEYVEGLYKEMVETVLSRVLTFTQAFTGTTATDRVPGIRSSKWAADKAFDRIIYWIGNTDEGRQTYAYEYERIQKLLNTKLEWFMEGRVSEQSRTFFNEIKRREHPPI